MPLPEHLQRPALQALGGAGGALPGIAFFTTWPPALFPEITLLVTALSAAVIVYAEVFHEPGGVDAPSRSLLLLFCAVTSLLAYGVLMSVCTVPHPAVPLRYPIGWDVADWGLTAYGRELKAANPAHNTPAMLIDLIGWRPDASYVIWRRDVIVAFGAIGIALYTAGFVTWTYAFATLAAEKKHHLGRTAPST